MDTRSAEHLAERKHRVNSMTFPGALFWKWSFRAHFHALIVGAIFGIIWMGVANLAAADTVVASRAGFVLSFIIDTSFVYLVGVLGALCGLALQTWGVIGWVIAEGKAKLFQGWILALFLSLLIGVASRWLQASYGVFYDSLGILGLNFVITGMIAFGTAFHVYCVYATMDNKQRREYLSTFRESDWKQRTKRILPVFDRNKTLFGMLFGGILTMLVFTVAYYLDNFRGDGLMVPVYFAVLMSISFSLMSNVYRIADTMRPFGERDRLYPYFEDYR